MLVINYKGITPQQRFYSIGVQGDNKANTIRFAIESQQGDLDISSFIPYLKVVSKEGGYADKIRLDWNGNTDEIYTYFDWEMTRKSTHYRNLELQLQLENEDEDIVFQSQIVEIELNGTLDVDKEIGEEHPSELQRLERDVDELRDDVNDLNVEMDKKVQKTNQPSKVYGTDENGNQTLYPKDSFGQVEDVKVNDVSVVEEKVAKINLTPYAKLIGELPHYEVSGTMKISTFFNRYSVLDKIIVLCIERNNEIIGRYLGIIKLVGGLYRFFFVALGEEYLNKFLTFSGEVQTNLVSNSNISVLFSNTYAHNFEYTSNKTTTITDQSTDTQYASAKAVWTLVQAIKRNAFTPVNIETYPTLADFLASTGEEGYLYLYPVDTSDLTKGYKQYIWESNQWVYMGNTQLDLTNYYTKQEANENVVKYQETATIVGNALTNINGKTLQTFEATLITLGVARYHITKSGNELTREEAVDYISRMSGTRYIPEYNYDYPRNSLWVFADGTFWKPQFSEDSESQYYGMYLFAIPHPFARKDQNETITGQWTFANAILSFLNSQASGNAYYSIEENQYGEFVISRTYNNNKVNMWVVNCYNLMPATDNTSDIGSQNKQVKDIYVKGKLKDGTNEVSVSEISKKDLIGDEYDNTKTYAVGDLVIYNNTLYKCITAITTAEDFDSTKWQATTIKNEMVNVSQNQIIQGTKQFNVVSFQNPNGSKSNKLEIKDDNGYNGKISYGGYKFMLQPNLITFFKTLVPDGDGVLNIGSANQRVKEIYVSDKISDGTNEAGIVDLANLIAYAKEQGWIS